MCSGERGEGDGVRRLLRTFAFVPNDQAGHEEGMSRRLLAIPFWKKNSGCIAENWLLGTNSEIREKKKDAISLT